MGAVSLKACDECGLSGHMLMNKGPNSWTMTSTVLCYSCMCDRFPIAIKITGGIDYCRYVAQEIRFPNVHHTLGHPSTIREEVPPKNRHATKSKDDEEYIP